MALRFYNTLSQRVEEFSTLHPGEVRMYTCGPTVYSFVHIGNFRTFMFQDLLRRWLAYRGYRLNHVMNITDVDDKIIRNAVAANQSLQEYTTGYEKAFLEDSQTLRLQKPERLVRATEHIPEMVEAIEELDRKGFTYQSEGSTYYRIARFDQYGKLSHLDLGGILSGARVDVDEYEKADARDFVLWKARKEGEPYWDSSLGPGRPGWHIECSAMAMKYLGETLDIHAGGVDLTFPHHENEIAQSEALTGRTFARFWLHSEHLMVEGQKMAKSLGNFYTLRDVFAKDPAIHPEAVRYLLASVPYRKKLNFTFDGLQQARTSIERLRNFEQRIQTSRVEPGRNEAIEERTRKALSDFESSLDDDLNTAEALAAIFEYIRDVNSAMDSGEFLEGNTPAALGLLRRFDSIFDVLAPTASESGLPAEQIEALIAERNRARQSRQFARSDEIRQMLLEQGVVLEDTKEGTRWKRK
jgi:cysteinyl-tRNA synthetase